MRVVLQVVDKASVEVDNKIVSSVEKGYLLLVGVFDTDNDENAIKLANKVAKLRVFPDSEGKTNLSLNDVGGSVLSVSQFTLCGDVKNTNRPSFFNAAKKEKAIKLYELFNKELINLGFDVQCGVFGAEMKVNLVNNGPFTLIVDN